MIEILRTIDGNEAVICSLADDNASVVDELMSRQEVNIDVIVDSPLNIHVGDYVRVDGTVYTLNRETGFEKRSDVEYRYDFVFESPLYRLLDKVFTHPITGVSTFTISRTLKEWVKLVVDCINTIDSGWTVANNIPNTEPINIFFENVSCREAISRFSQEFGVEYFLSGKEVYFIDRIENKTGLAFEQGKGKGLYTITQEPVDTENTITRVYPYGGTMNVAPTEGDANGRIYLPEKYLENFSEYSKVVEKVVIFEDIYPRFTGGVEKVSGDYNRLITCHAIDFDISAQAIGGTKAKINFLSGDLMGESFEFAWDNSKKEINLVRKEDETALPDSEGKKPLIPHDLKKAEVGDTFNFTDIIMPTSYKNNAVNLLRQTATDWLSYYSRLRVKFTLEVDYRFLRGKHVLKSGDLVTVKIPEAGVDKLLRVNSVERNLKTGKMTCSVSNYLDEKWEKKIEGTISDIQNTISKGFGFVQPIEIIEEHDLTEPTNRNVYSALASLAHFLRKDAPDAANELLKFLKGAEFGEFSSGIHTGKGAKIWPDGKAEFMSALIRGRLDAAEFRYNRVYLTGNELWITDGAKFEEVTKVGDFFNVKLLLEEGELIPLEEGDILKGIFYDMSEDGNIKGFRALWYRVTAVNQDLKTITIASRYPNDEKYDPVPLLNVARIGSFTNEERQRSILIDAKENCITFLDHVNTWDIVPSNEVCWLGRKDRSLPGIPSTKRYNGRMSNLIISGRIYQYDDTTETEYLIPIDKGKYKNNEFYSYYNRVSSKGGLWLCVNENGTTSAPSPESPDWQLQVSDGSYAKFQYAAGSNLMTAPDSGWQDVPPVVEPGEYLWMRTGFVFPPATEPEEWSPARIGGEKGGLDINHIEEDYSTETEYKVGDVVKFNGGKIYCKKANKGITPVPFYTTGGQFLKTGGMYLLAVPLSAENINKEYWVIFQDKPKEAVMRWLTSPTSVIRFNTLGNPVPSSVVVSCKRQRAGYSVEDCVDLYLVYRTYAETTYISQSTPIKTVSVTLTNLRSDGIYYVRGYESEQDAKGWNENFSAEFTLTHSNDGEKGLTGASPRPRGIWSGTVTNYGWTEQYRDFVIRTVNGVNIKYVAKVEGTIPANMDPASAAGASYWEQAQEFEFLATSLLLADKIKAEDIDTENLAVKKLDGATGSFKSLNCINSEGQITGGISFNSEGKMLFSGDINHQGTVSGRNFVFRAANLWARTSFGARQRNTLVVFGSYGYVYYDGLNETASNRTYITLSRGTTTNGYTYYVIPTYLTQSVEIAGMPIDLVIIYTSTSYNYVLEGLPSKEVILYNGYDTNNEIYVYSNGNRHQMPGGFVTGYLYVGNFMYPSIASDIAGRGWMVMYEYDNTWA